jgi:hypothetical protein
MQDQIEQLKEAILNSDISTKELLEEFRIKYLGSKGTIKGWSQLRLHQIKLEMQSFYRWVCKNIATKWN